jgi:hypothetical protein
MLAAPAGPGGQVSDADAAAAGDDLAPDKGHFGIDKPICLEPSRQRRADQRETLRPGSRVMELLPDARHVAAPQIIERNHTPTQLRWRDPEHGARDDRGQTYLHTLDGHDARVE